MWSDPSPSMLNSTILFTNSSCAFYLKLVQNLHCVLLRWRICEQNVKTYLIQNFRFCRSNRSGSHEIPIYSLTISHDLHFSVRGWHMSSEWEGSGARSSYFFGRTVFHRGYKYPLSPSSLPLLRSTSLSRSSFSNPSTATTSSSPVRKSFTASTSSPSYSRRPRKSSLRRRRSRLPPPS